MPYINVILAYLLGSIPFGLILSHFFGNGNLRTQGSKNIGATNVLRTQGKLLGGITFFLDFFKAALACYLFFTDNLFINILIIAAPVIGHMFPIWLKFKGGKGIASYFGIIFAISPLAFSGTILVWITVFYITKISSIAGLTSVLAGLILFATVRYSFHISFLNELYMLCFLACIIFVKHLENIKRLIEKKEFKI